MDAAKNISKYVITYLDKKYNRAGFQYGVEILDEYLKTQASQDMKKNVAVPYELVADGSDHILGYYTLSSIGIVVDKLPKDIIKKLPRYLVLPGILIERLARDNELRGKYIGNYL